MKRVAPVPKHEDEDEDEPIHQPSPWERLEDRGGDDEDDDDDKEADGEGPNDGEVEDEEQAANILTSVLPDIKKAGNVPSAEYEDLLDCLASLASRQLPLEPLNKTVARMSVDDIGISSSSTSSLGNPRRSSLEAPSEEGADSPPLRRRPRAVSNPEGCDVWKAYERGLGDSSDSSQSGTRSPTLPHMLAKYANVYNKNGRIGIYTREERDAIIARFREKRSRRVWAKKIRYSCRKNLADKRTRVKGRFVKITDESDAMDTGNASGKTLRTIDERKPSVDYDEDDVTQGNTWDEEGNSTVPHKRMRRHSIA